MADAPKKPTSDNASVLRLLGQTAGVGFEFLLTVGLPLGLGYWLDRKFGSLPWLMLVLGCLGFAVGLYRMLKTGAAVMKQ
jgi:F0F1-type ATP synthase assembly protein I